MTGPTHSRRQFLKLAGLGASAVALAPAYAQQDAPVLAVGSQPRYGLSPYLYMQFMEPLGNTDSSVAAAWDAGTDRWRDDVIEATSKLGPTLLRWGGALASYYRWKEAVGPRDKRVPMLNLCWGGVETNQVGTVEFVDFCRQVGADPLMCVNFESDGRDFWSKDPKGNIRTAGPEEAAHWVSFCNSPQDSLRTQYGIEQPCRIPLWQIGNETSYFGNVFGCHDRDKSLETAAKKTVEFAQAMRAADPTIELIGWGDSGWGPRMLEIAGEHLQYVAFHHMFDPDGGAADSPLQGIEYRKDPAQTWEHLMNAARVHNERIQRMREEVAGFSTPLALTECHFALPGRNRCEVLSSWAAGVANARLLNVHERHGDVLKIATLADFCGTRWQVNAVMIPVPEGQSFLMPVALVMCLYRHHTGTHAVDVIKTPEGLDVTASRSEDRIYLHVVNTNRTQGVSTALGVDDCTIESGKVFQLAADPQFEVIGTTLEEIPIEELAMTSPGQWTFPAASVSAVELRVKHTGG
jgi:alpha-L-arabinofuranosidase